MAAAGRWFVECPAHTAGPFPSEDSARQVLGHVEALGACMFDHQVRKADAEQAPT